MTMNPTAWIRGSVLAVVILAVLVATLAGAAASGKIDPVSRFGRTVSRLAHPVLEPVHRRIQIDGSARLPATFWFGVTAVVIGALASSALEWGLLPCRGPTRSADETTPRKSRVVAINVTFAVAMAFVTAGLCGAILGGRRRLLWMMPWTLTAGGVIDQMSPSLPRIALFNIGGFVLFALLRAGRWWAMRYT